MTRRGMWALALVVVLAGAAQAIPFDGVGGDELPTLPTCWGTCPPVAGEEFASCLVFTHLNPFQCLVVPRYHASDSIPPLPGGLNFWRPAATTDPCPPGTGQAVRLIVQDRRHYAIDSGCWTPD